VNVGVIVPDMYKSSKVCPVNILNNLLTFNEIYLYDRISILRKTWKLYFYLNIGIILFVKYKELYY